MSEWALATPSLGMPDITTFVDADGDDYVQPPALGTVIRAVHPTYGEGEFIWLNGVAATDAGDVVTYDAAFQTAIASIALNVPRPLAVAMSASVATEAGWYQIGGLSVMNKSAATSFAAGAALGVTSGLAVAAASDLIVMGAAIAVVASAASGRTTVQVMVNRPHGPGGAT